MIKGIIFDIDDTIYSFIHCHNKAMIDLYKYFYDKFNLSSNEYDLMYLDLQNKMRESIGDVSAIHTRVIVLSEMIKILGDNNLEDAYFLEMNYWNTLNSSIKKDENLINFIKDLKNKNIKIGFCTDMTAYIQYEKLYKLGILKLADFIISSEKAGIEKPHSDIFKACHMEIGCEKEEVLFIGDNYKKDYLGAKNYGFIPILTGEYVNRLSNKEIIENNINYIESKYDIIKYL